MKNAIWLMTILFFTLHLGDLEAQREVRTPRIGMKTNPILTSLGWFNLTTEFTVNERASMLIRADLIGGSIFESRNGVGLGLGYRFYFTHERVDVPEGFHIQPFVYGNLPFGSGDEFFGVFGAQTGYQFVWDSGFMLDLGLGPGLYFLSDGDADIFPVATFGLGYCWNKK